jgi:hypothetical protein
MLKHPVPANPTVELILQIGSGIFWTITYLLILRRAKKDKSYGMPLVALCANVSWEFIFSFVFPHPVPQLYINYVWLLFDVGLLLQYLKYGRKDFVKNLPFPLFYANFFFTLVLAALMILLISYEFDEYIGIYAAFGQNLLMSALFISLLLKRKNEAGQSIYIALCKMIGTLLPSTLFFLYFPHSYLLILLYAAIFIYDLAYFLLLYRQLKMVGISPWQRV